MKSDGDASLAFAIFALAFSMFVLGVSIARPKRACDADDSKYALAATGEHGMKVCK